MFLLDESTSVADQSGWAQTLDFIKEVASEFTIGRQIAVSSVTNARGFTGDLQTRVSVGTFSSFAERGTNGDVTPAYTHVSFDDFVDGNIVDASTFNTAVDAIPQTPGATFTREGMELVRDNMLRPWRTDPAATEPFMEAARVLVVISNNAHTRGHNPTSVSQSLRDDNRTIVLGVAIGTPGNGVTASVLATEIASTVSVSVLGTVDRTVVAEGYESLQELAPLLRSQLCTRAQAGPDRLKYCTQLVEDRTPRGAAPLTGCGAEHHFHGDRTAISELCPATCAYWDGNPASSAPSAAPTVSPTPEPTGSPTLPCAADVSAVCSSDMCCTTNPMQLQLMSQYCRGTCCGVTPESCAITTTAPTTSEPTPATTTTAPTPPPTLAPTDGCGEDLSAHCVRSLCCATDPLHRQLVGQYCQATCCGNGAELCPNRLA